MSRRAFASAVLAAAAVGVPLAGLPANVQAAAHIKSGFYDCWGYSGTFFTYYGTYQFATPGAYAFGADRKGNHFVGKVDHGKYKLHGKKIIPTSGPMKRNHLYMQQETTRKLLLLNDNHTSSDIACYLYTGH